MRYKSGRHFLQIPGPTNVPERVLKAMSRPTINHRGPEFASLTREVLEGLGTIFKTDQPVIIFPASGHGAWEAAMVNALSPGDEILMYETGHFARLWRDTAERLDLKAELMPGDWRHGADPEAIEARLADDEQHKIKAVAIVHCETSTGVVSRIFEIRQAMNRAGHPALLMVDTISSLGSFDYRHDEWGVDVTAGASQKGLLLPPGLAFNAISEKAQAASKAAGMARSYWDWSSHFGPNQSGLFPYTPATNLLYGLKEAITLLLEEGLDAVFARHHRHAEATRRAVETWGLENQCANPEEYSDSVTAVRMPDGHDADEMRKLILERFDMSLGNGLGKVKGRLFRIGHLGDFNDLMLAGTLCGVEMGLSLAKVPFSKGGVAAALDYLAG